MHAAQRYVLLPFLRSVVSLACVHPSCAGATAVAIIHSSFTGHGLEGGIFSLEDGMEWNGGIFLTARVRSVNLSLCVSARRAHTAAEIDLR